MFGKPLFPGRFVAHPRSGCQQSGQFSSVILNVDMLVIKELEPLFMQLW